MKKLTLWVVAALCLGLAASTQAQFTQDEDDLGAADTVDIVFTVLPDAASEHMTLQMDLYVFNDSNIIGGATVGFDWDNPNLVMDSAVVSPMMDTSLEYMNILYRNDQLDSTNSHRQFVFASARMFGPGVNATASRQLWASYYFTLTEWDVDDSVVVDTVRFSWGSNFKFVDVDKNAYKPFWAGPKTGYDTPCCIGLNGNVDCSANQEPDIGDVNEMIRLLFINPGAVPCCFDEADLDFNGIIDVGDLTILQERLFITLLPFDPCP